MRVILREWGKPEPFYPIRIDRIEKAAEEWKKLLGLHEPPFALSGNMSKMSARGVTGFIKIDNIDIEIIPKFLQETEGTEWRTSLWNILSLTNNYLRSIFESASINNTCDETTFFDILGQSYLDSLNVSVEGGFPRGYIEKEMVFKDIRGNINFNKIEYILKNPYNFPCIYSEFDENIAINNLLKWAGLLLSEKVLSSSLSYMLHKAAMSIAADGVPPSPIVAQNIQLPVEYLHLNTALEISKKLLNQKSMYYSMGPFDSFGFLWKSHQVYEDFIHLLLKISLKYLDQNMSVIKKPKIDVAFPDINANKNIMEYPDFIMKGKHSKLIIDAKYKVKNILNTNDLNQIIVACKILRCLHGILIYPALDGQKTSHSTWRLNSNGFPKYVSSIHLNLSNMSVKGGEYTLARELSFELKKICSYR